MKRKGKKKGGKRSKRRNNKRKQGKWTSMESQKHVKI